GEDMGAWMAPAAIDNASVTRSYAASAYYAPITHCSNLVVLMAAKATCICSIKSGKSVTVTRVELLLGGQNHSISVRPGAEVILSTSAVKTPQLLELSGIGDPKILNALGCIEYKVDLPGVGEGMVDQVFFGVSFGKFSTVVSCAPKDRKKYITFTGDLQFPFSTGSIHATSKDSGTQPLIDPNYYEQSLTHSSDLQVMVGILKLLRKLGNPGGPTVQTNEQIMGAFAEKKKSLFQIWIVLDYIKNHGSTEYHTIRAAAMLPQEKAGVVSPELKVYRTTNIHIVDLSILPLQISAHPMSTL
ncbi:GMC oxidoreductase-domain-containing protein, partial [Mycena sp. CBHHK59/15]